MSDMLHAGSPSAFSALGPIVRLASALADPFTTFDKSGWSMGGLSPEEIRGISRDPAFSRPIRRAVTAQVAASLTPLSADEFRSLAASPEGRFAILLLKEPLEEIREVALMIAAATMHRDILAATGKVERQALRAALGADAYQLATREAPMLYSGFSKLGDTARFRAILGSGVDEAAMRGQFADFGLGLMLRAVAAKAPVITDLVLRRLPAGRRPDVAGRTETIDFRQLTRLIQRRMPSWLAIIG